MQILSPKHVATLGLTALLAAALPAAAGTRPPFLPVSPQAGSDARTQPDKSNFIGDGSFESPVVPVGSYQAFQVGYMLGNWSVVGPSGSSVLLISNQFTELGFSFPAAQGKQSLDLTGAGGNLPGGVAQTVTTTPGTNYTLSFEVGNIASAPEGPTATVLVMVNGVQLLTAENSSGQGLNYEEWEPFDASFTATGSSTTITFINENGPASGSNGLDNVKLTVQK